MKKARQGNLPLSIIDSLALEQPDLYLNREGFLILDRDLKVSFWSKSLEAITGITAQEILHQDPFKSKLGKYINRKGILEQALTEDSSLLFSQKDDATGNWFSISIFPKDDMLFITIRDITEEKIKERELTTVKNLKKHVLNSTSDIIWAIDRDYHLLFGNDSYYSLMKRNSGREISIGDNVLKEALKTDSRGKRITMWKDLYDKSLQGNCESTIFSILEERRESIFEVTAQPVISNDKEKNIIGVACFARDLTEKYQHIASIEKQNQRLKDIAWLQSHKVRAPLANILGLTDLVIHTEDAEEQKEFLQLLLRSARELDAIIKKIAKRAGEE